MPATQTNPAHQPKLPPAVKKLAAEAERLQAEAYPDQAAAQPAPAPVPAPEGTPASPQPAPAPTQPAPAPVQPVVQTPAPAPQHTPEVDVRMWQGRVDAERERAQDLQSALNRTNEMLAGLQNKVRDLEAKAVPAAPPKRYITDEEEEEMGTGLLDVMGRRAQEVMEGKVSQLEAYIKRLEGALVNVGGKVDQNEIEKVWQQLDRAVPNWEAINVDDNFLRWLEGNIPYTKVQRGTELGRAFDLKDVPAVINFFQGYIHEAAATGTPVPGVSAALGGTPTTGRPTLESFAAPGRANPTPAATAPPGQKPYYTPSGIARYHTEKAKGLWRGRDDEVRKIDADIILASVEGRIQPDR
jgi:hypothetical protein